MGPAYTRRVFFFRNRYSMVQIASFYLFVPISAEALQALSAEVRALAEAHALRGLVVLACEGANATVSGAALGIAAFKELMTLRLQGAPIIWKESTAEREVFRRFKVDVRPEIVTIGDTTIQPSEAADSDMTPEEWERTLESDPDVVVLDTRIAYETAVGKFRAAVDPGLSSFSEFVPYVQSTPFPKDRKVLMYCTGGVRCEKAAVVMRRAGYKNVFQLEGGILKYLEQFPHRHFEGECYVFDHRVAVDQELKPSAQYGLCPHCGDPSSVSIECAECGKSAKLCERCVGSLGPPSCSKNCAYHVNRRGTGALSGVPG